LVAVLLPVPVAAPPSLVLAVAPVVAELVDRLLEPSAVLPPLLVDVVLGLLVALVVLLAVAEPCVAAEPCVDALPPAPLPAGISVVAPSSEHAEPSSRRVPAISCRVLAGLGVRERASTACLSRASAIGRSAS